jgi:hypothetical protein
LVLVNKGECMKQVYVCVFFFVFVQSITKRHFSDELQSRDNILSDFDRGFLLKFITGFTAGKVVNASWDSTFTDYYFRVAGERESVVIHLGSFEGPSHLGI